MSARTEYESRLEARQQSFDQLRNRDDQIANFRVAIFLLGVLLAWVVFGGWQVPWQFLLIPLALFFVTIFYHTTIKRQQRVARRAIDYYKRCLQRLDGQWSGVGPTGEQFLDPLHHYAGDLDIFGNGSLFQLLNSPITPVGATNLATWLASTTETPPPTLETIQKRQNAVRHLHGQLDLRERLAVIGPTTQSQQDANELQKWLTNPGDLTATWIRLVGMTLGALGAVSLYHWLTTGSVAAMILVIFAQLGFLHFLREPLDAIKKYSEHAVDELHRIKQVLAALETLQTDDPELNRLRHQIAGDTAPASQVIEKIERTVSQFENMRRNIYVAPLAFITMTNLHFACAIDHWRSQHGPHVENWFTAIGELETLLAFSQLHFENPDYCFPKFVDDAPQFIATQLAHPLLHGAVANDIELSDNCRLLLVSGSNMSGKSTQLRSVGVNTVLAMAGAPVCAQELMLSRLQVAAAMRMQDSLQSGTSHFFAELKRIQLVVELAKQSNNSVPVLFLLDEILHGTNSHDRLVGARGVIKSLLDAGALGLVTTHDLALAEMVTELDTPARNVHFRDQWVDGQMTFDYQMQQGVVPKSNALSLMRLLGLEV